MKWRHASRAQIMPKHKGDSSASETLARSIAKSLSYRIAIMALDFLSIYLFTGKAQIALGFMIVSNIYTTAGYFFHERIWNKISWGKKCR